MPWSKIWRPKSLKLWFKRRVDYLLSQSLMQLSRQGIDINKIFDPGDGGDHCAIAPAPDAVDRLRRTLALGEVAKTEGIKVEEEALQTKNRRDDEGHRRPQSD